MNKSVPASSNVHTSTHLILYPVRIILQYDTTSTTPLLNFYATVDAHDKPAAAHVPDGAAFQK